MEAMKARFATFTTHFSPAVHAGQAAISNATVTAWMSGISIAKFNNNGYIDTYLNTFGCAAVLNQWEKSIWALRLRGLVTGKI